MLLGCWSNGIIMRSLNPDLCCPPTDPIQAHKWEEIIEWTWDGKRRWWGGGSPSDMVVLGPAIPPLPSWRSLSLSFYNLCGIFLRSPRRIPETHPNTRSMANKTCKKSHHCPFGYGAIAVLTGLVDGRSNEANIHPWIPFEDSTLIDSHHSFVHLIWSHVIEGSHLVTISNTLDSSLGPRHHVSGAFTRIARLSMGTPPFGNGSMGSMRPPLGVFRRQLDIFYSREIYHCSHSIGNDLDSRDLRPSHGADTVSDIGCGLLGLVKRRLENWNEIYFFFQGLEVDRTGLYHGEFVGD